MSVIALLSQIGVREIANLERLGETLRWVDDDSARSVAEPLVVTGTLAAEAADRLRGLLVARMKAGLGSLLIPRFRPCDLADVLAAPSAIEVLPVETTELDWNGTPYRVPGSVVFRTKLHVNKWAIVPGCGAQLLAFQPTTARGRVVLCAASVTLRRVGVDAGEQQRLLEALLRMCRPVTGTEADAVHQGTAEAGMKTALRNGPLSPSGLLEEEPEQGPGLLLALLFGASRDSADEIIQRASDLVGVRLDPAHVGPLARRITGSNDEIEAALVRGGWGTFLRKVRQRLAEVSDE